MVFNGTAKNIEKILPKLLNATEIDGDFLSSKSRGICAFCKETFPQKKMREHLTEEIMKLPRESKNKKSTYFLIKMALKPYFLYLLADKAGNLSSIDGQLRECWLECCGHMSAIQIFSPENIESYSSSMDYGREEKNKNYVLDSTPTAKLELGRVFEHVYDFGTSTNTVGCVVKIFEFDAPLVMFEGKKGCLPVGQNIKEPVLCVECSKEGETCDAEQFCMECSEKKLYGLCETHVEEHDCDEGSLYGVANSPRQGSCGFTDLGDIVGKIVFKGSTQEEKSKGDGKEEDHKRKKGAKSSQSKKKKT